MLIVETSHPMHRRVDGVSKTVANLLASGIGGQIQQGDTLGVWTYNQELYTGRLPLQRWSKYEREDISSSILKFVKAQKYEKQPTFSSVRPALDKVIKDSEFITIILISSGEDAMSGTPFDDKINDLYKKWREEQEKARMPLVTVLRAKRSTMTGFSVTPPPWQIEIPAWPAEPAIARAAFPETPAAKVQPSSVPPLIFTGKKPKPPEATNSTEAATATSQPASPSPEIQQTKPANPPVEPAAPEPKSVAPEPSHSVSQKPSTELHAETLTTIERNGVEKSPNPQRPSEPTPGASKDVVSSAAISKSQPITPAVTERTNAPAAIQSAQKAAPPEQDISTGVATPGAGLLSNKGVWIAGVAVLAITCGVIFMLARRPRSEPVSLITRSLGRERND